MKILVTALIKVYNEAQFISASLISLKNCVDKIVVVDGAYELYYRNFKKFDERAKPWSTDGTLEIIQGMKGLPELHLIRCEKPWINQVEKLNLMMDQTEPGEWFFIIDGDEMVIGSFEKAMEEILGSGCVIGRLPLVNLGADIDRLHYYWHPRIFLKQKGMHYEGTHWQLRDFADRIMEATYPVWWSQHAVIAHFKLLKTQARLAPHQAYMDLVRARGWLEPLRQEMQKN